MSLRSTQLLRKSNSIWILLNILYTIEGRFALLKRGVLGIYHHVSEKHLIMYCDEFSFRYNTRKGLDSDRFDMFLSQCNSRLTYENLIR